MPVRERRALLTALVSAALVLSTLSVAYAQTRHPFAVGAGEGGAAGSGLAAWLVGEQARLQRLITGAVRGSRDGAAAFWTLAGLSFAYGVFHAAGPGHGKAVMASYMVANERALRRGLVLTAAAALLQALVAIALVGVFAILLGATAARLTDAAAAIELASYAAVAGLGAWLVWRKGRALVEALAVARAPALGAGLAWAAAGEGRSAFSCEAVEPGHIHDAACAHCHAPDPASLGDDFSWGPALGAVAAAGARPCSGAILVLVFALAQGAFAMGVASALCMALGTALTTGAIAAAAVFAKRAAGRILGGEGRRALLLARGAEFAAACFVLVVGVALLLGSRFAQSVA